ncbi:hypothetical protein VTO73DRAFT_8824 [Trametes versicolor]
MDQSIAHGLLAGGVSLRLLPAVLPPDLSGAQAALPISFCMATPAALLLVGYAVFDKVYLCPRSHMLNWRVRLMQASVGVELTVGVRWWSTTLYIGPYERRSVRKVREAGSCHGRNTISDSGAFYCYEEDIVVCIREAVLFIHSRGRGTSAKAPVSITRRMTMRQMRVGKCLPPYPMALCICVSGRGVLWAHRHFTSALGIPRISALRPTPCPDIITAEPPRHGGAHSSKPQCSGKDHRVRWRELPQLQNADPVNLASNHITFAAVNSRGHLSSRPLVFRSSA